MIPVQQIVSGQAIGSALSVQDSATLAQIGIGGLTVGTWAYNTGVGAFFQLSVSSAALVTDQVVAVANVDGWRWIKQSLATTALATASTPGLMSAAQFLALEGVPSGSAVPAAMQSAYSDVLDLKTPAQFTLIPPVAARLRINSVGFEIKSTSGASVSPTFSLGGNSTSFNNACASQTVAGLASQAAETYVLAAILNPQAAVDLTTSGLVLNITGGATATTLTARIFVLYALLPV